MKFSSSLVPLKSEDDGSRASKLDRRQTEVNGEDCGEPEPDNSFHPHERFNKENEDCSECDTDDSDFWHEANEPQSDFKTKKVSQCPRTTNTDKERLNLRSRTGEKPDLCSLEFKQDSQRQYLEPHTIVKTNKKQKNIQIKEEPQDDWISQGAVDAEHFLPFDPVTVKSETDEKRVYSAAHQRQTEENRDNCGGVEPVKNLGPAHQHINAKDLVSCKSDSVDIDPSDGVTNFTKDVMRTQNLEHESNHFCPECDKTFHGKSALNEHMQVHTRKKLFSCSICEKTFIKSAYLYSHMKAHEGQKLYPCLQCDKRFNKSSQLWSHMRIHQGQKQFACSECGKKFVRKENLQTHMKIHSGERPFSCTVCQRTFKVKYEVKKHMLSHTGEKRFACPVCHKRFTRNIHVTVHMNLHTREIPFSCSVCQRVFLNKCSVRSHMASHAEKLVCPVCGIKITHKSSLRRHMGRYHASVGGETT